jgi:hypothetical protein
MILYWQDKDKYIPILSTFSSSKTFLRSLLLQNLTHISFMIYMTFQDEMFLEEDRFLEY